MAIEQKRNGRFLAWESHRTLHGCPSRSAMDHLRPRRSVAVAPLATCEVGEVPPRTLNHGQGRAYQYSNVQYVVNNPGIVKLDWAHISTI